MTFTFRTGVRQELDRSETGAGQELDPFIKHIQTSKNIKNKNKQDFFENEKKEESNKPNAADPF